MNRRTEWQTSPEVEKICKIILLIWKKSRQNMVGRPNNKPRCDALAHGITYIRGKKIVQVFYAAGRGFILTGKSSLSPYWGLDEIFKGNRPDSLVARTLWSSLIKLHTSLVIIYQQTQHITYVTILCCTHRREFTLDKKDSHKKKYSSTLTSCKMTFPQKKYSSILSSCKMTFPQKKYSSILLSCKMVKNWSYDSWTNTT